MFDFNSSAQLMRAACDRGFTYTQLTQWAAECGLTAPSECEWVGYCEANPY